VQYVASVASFFVSRIDALVDPLLAAIIARGGAPADLATRACGQVASASAAMAYHLSRELFSSERFGELAAQGARVQRLLWASTGTKNPDYSDIKYIEALIAPGTVTTIPRETLAAYRDHGRPEARLGQAVEEARHVLALLGQLGINLDTLTRQLAEEGVAKFSQPFDALLATLAQRSGLHALLESTVA
jgi:transaldolase